MITKRSFGVLLFTLAALAADAGLLRHKRRQRHSSSSSSYSFSFKIADDTCLNGGTSIPSLLTGEHMFCLCLRGFEGTHCETALGESCYEGAGLYYRGTVSKSHSGKTCEPWDSDARSRYLSSDLHSGWHNYCRNLYYRRRPWCYVRKNQELVQEYCDIPRCDVELITTTPAPSEPPTELTCGQRSRRKQTKIVGGTVATVESHPWMAAIFWRSKSGHTVFLCGGSLISGCWVLTAAHCFHDGSRSKPGHFSVTLGKNALNESDPNVEQRFGVEEIFIHEEFDDSEGNYNNDIALLKLRAKHGKCAKESNLVKTVCLPPPQQSLRPGVSCEICGYGKEKHSLWYRSQYLRQAQVNLLADDVCRRSDYYGDLITDNMLCAGRADWSQDACEGDSGGPLVCGFDGKFFLFGVISWGDGCAKEFRPGVYTKVTNYNKWIEQKTGLAAITAGNMFPQK
ncbi:urokinase-type plasminogen activator-like [Mugil cephalus]|uniref:urokinase-type plasminogen activator-like n=1 Tax=Mugil cephalus TaxID=48193 RepID=UPI001FB7BC16|nr:urokinase-type plasminogen activator-like [Mugil cephalus]